MPVISAWTTHALRSGERARARTTALALLALLLGTLLMGTVFTPAASAQDQPTDSGQLGEPTIPLVVIGVTGLNWEDVTPETTPRLWAYAQNAAVGNLVVRSVRSFTCPADGWLALSTGARTADAALNPCRLLADPYDFSDGVGNVPAWPEYEAANSSSNYTATLGAFGQDVLDGGLSSAAIGPGAAIALATTDGTVHNYSPRASDPLDLTIQVIEATTDHDVVVIDAGEIRAYVAPDVESPPEVDEDAFHLAQVQAVEANLAAVLDGVAASESGARVVIASVADLGRTPGLQLLAATGPGFTPGSPAFADATLISPSTRQVGLVQSTDLLPGFLAALSITEVSGPGTLVGTAPYASPGGTGESRIDALRDVELHAQAMRPLVAPFYLLLVILNVALYAAVALGLTRPAATRTGTAVARWLRIQGRSFSLSEARPRVLNGLRTVSIALASVPVATFLANLVPWWRVGSPALGLAVVTLVIVALVTAIALARPWKHQILTPLGIVAGLTAIVLVADVATGARLQLSAVMGVPVLVAGRFYGFNNTAFALFATAAVLLAVALTNPLIRRGKRGLAALIVSAIGVIAAGVDGAPSIGADFGGPPAIIPAFAILALMAAGIKVTWRRVILVLGGAVVATGLFAYVDYLRGPEQRTHLGGFVATLLDGGAFDVVLRKLEANLRILANNRPLTILAITGIALVVFVLARPIRTVITSPGGGKFAWLSSGAPISQMATTTPMLKPGLVALAVLMGIGFAVNDSGIAIPAYGVAVAVPLLLAACASWMLTLKPSEAEAANYSPSGGAEG